MTTVEQIVRSGGYGTRDYWRAVRRGKSEDETPAVTDYPAPERTTNDPVPADLVLPGPVVKARDLAQAHDWTVRVGYSRGCYPHASTGRPGPLGDWISVQALHPKTRAHVVMLYSVTGKAWKSVLLITGTAMTTKGTATDALAFLELRGRVILLGEWIAQRAADRAALAASRPRRASTRTVREADHA